MQNEASVPSEVEGQIACHSFIWHIAQNNNSKLYVGVSKQPYFRLKEHNTQRGSVFTKYGNFKVVFQEDYLTLADARQREIQIKKWRREKKETLIKKYQQGLPTKLS